MVSDSILLIPYLSKELNLIGLPPLPYSLKKLNSKLKNKNEENFKVLFDSNLMVQTLASTCFELVKRIKTFGEVDNDVIDKLQFKNLKLEKQLKTCQAEVKKNKTELENIKELNRQLQEKIDLLEMKLKDSKVKLKCSANKHQINEDLLKHALCKKESSIFELHKTIWKQFNLANQNYFPKNFEIIQLHQPNLNHLWSTVKYSDHKYKEEALKEAVCALEKSNRALIEENFSLKTFFFNIFLQFQETMRLMCEKMHVPNLNILGYKSSDLFFDVEKFDILMFDNILKETFRVIKKICKLFKESSFMVSDDLFICWSSIIKRI